MLKEVIDLHRQGRLDEAEQGYRARLMDQPDDVDALHLLGLLRHQRGDAGEGTRLLERAHTLAPDDASIELSVASLHFRNGDHASARRGFERALALDPNLGGAHAGIGQLALLDGESERAEQHFRVALRTGEEPHALAGLGALLLERGDVEGALRHIGRAADLAPHDPMIQMLLGRTFMARGTHAFAERAFANALRLRPNLHQARYFLASLLPPAKRYEEAESHFRQLIDAPGFEAIGHIGVADVARAQNHFEDAVTAYRAASAVAPLPAAAVLALATSLTQLGRHGEALAVYDEYLARSPQDDPISRARADLLMLMGRLLEAAIAWKAQLDRDPDDVPARSRMATLAEFLGQLDAARRQADIVLLARPDDAEMRLIRVRSLLRAGDDEQARTALEALSTLTLSEGQRRLGSNYLGHVRDRAGEVFAAVPCFADAQYGTLAAMPALDEPHPELRAALIEPVPEVWAQAPILLLGTPGSGVERVAALLADQPQLTVLRDRANGMLRDDDFNHPRFAQYCGELGEADRDALRARFLAPLRQAGIAPDRPVVDWLPRWDAHLLALVRRAMPGTRLIIVERDPRDALLNWLGFGWAAGFPCPAPIAAADWLVRARHHLGFASDLDEPRRLVIAADALSDDVDRIGTDLTRFLGLDAVKPGVQFAALEQGLGGLPARFAAGHWQAYREALAEAFLRLE